MKIIRFVLFAFAVTSVFSAVVTGQVTKKPVRNKTTASKSLTLPPLDVRAGRKKVSDQLDNVSRVVKLLDPIGQAIEALDAEAKTNRNISKQSLDKNTADKQKVVAAIRNIREGMVKLESEFRVKAALKKYLPMIQGISDLARQSETSAIAGKFVAANEPLRTVQQKLSDTLAAMPNAEL